MPGPPRGAGRDLPAASARAPGDRSLEGRVLHALGAPAFVASRSPGATVQRSVEGDVQEALDQVIGADDTRAQRARVERLTSLFASLPPGDAKALLSRLQRPEEPLARAFHWRLSTATRTHLFDILGTRAAEAPPPTTQEQARDVVEATREAPLAPAGPGPSFPATGDGPPTDVQLFSTWLVREGYVAQVASLLPADWRAMSEADLTAFLRERFTEAELRGRYLEVYAQRQGIKSTFRGISVVTALVIGLVWARKNLQQRDWGVAALKVGGSTAAAYAFNKLLYARDQTALELMESKIGNFGRWFQGAARTNKVVNFFTRRLGPALLIWDLKDVFMSGGYGGPNIPFDIIDEIDIDDPSTWHKPPQAWLDLGGNVWYQQRCTTAHPEACGTQIYLGKVEGSLLKTAAKVVGLLPEDVPSRKRQLYRVEGDWSEIDLFLFSIPRHHVSKSDGVVVLGTGRVGGEEIGGRGHYHKIEVVPANQAAVELFGGTSPQFVADWLLKPEASPDAPSAR